MVLILRKQKTAVVIKISHFGEECTVKIKLAQLLIQETNIEVTSYRSGVLKLLKLKEGRCM